jgi:hypothetical protein
MGVMSLGSGGCWLGLETLIVAVAVLPLPPSEEVTAVVTLFCDPAAMPVTLTAKLQEAPEDKVAPDRTMLVEPAVAVIVPVPQEPAIPLGVATTKPAGSTSVKPTALRELLALGLESVNVREVDAFRARLAAPKALEIAGGDTTGGAGPEADELPPQPSKLRRAAVTIVQVERARSPTGTLSSIR